MLYTIFTVEIPKKKKLVFYNIYKNDITGPEFTSSAYFSIYKTREEIVSEILDIYRLPPTVEQLNAAFSFEILYYILEVFLNHVGNANSLKKILGYLPVR
tara:strand:- start:12422 stop:12721 length:300 start_codon:yes stop_codon:yes gene_type:complete